MNLVVGRSFFNFCIDIIFQELKVLNEFVFQQAPLYLLIHLYQIGPYLYQLILFNRILLKYVIILLKRAELTLRDIAPHLRTQLIQLALARKSTHLLLQRLRDVFNCLYLPILHLNKLQPLQNPHSPVGIYLLLHHLHLLLQLRHLLLHLLTLRPTTQFHQQLVLQCLQFLRKLRDLLDFVHDARD